MMPDYGALMMPVMGMMSGMAEQQQGMMESMMLQSQLMNENMMNMMYEPEPINLPGTEAMLADRAEEQLSQLDKLRMGRASTILTTPALADTEPDLALKSLLGG
jgi:hypothetical protein